MSDAQNNIVVIDTGSAGDSRAFKNGFHQAEIERLKSMIEDSIPKDTKAGDGSAHSHQTIGVFGERGAGKTSFILSAIASIKTDNEVNVAFIGPIDPTLLEHGEQLLPHLIMAMLESNADLKKDIQNDPESPLTRAYMGCVRQLRVLSDQWSETLGKELMGDAETYGFELLEEMHSARNLRNSFQTFCQAALNKLNKNLFVIVIDDVDVAFEQGWPVLETVRKYLDFPQVLPVILGDFKLYRMLVMQRHHEKLAELRKVGDEKNRVDEGVVHLTNQYLLKVLPGHRRIELVCKAPFEVEEVSYRLDEKNGEDFTKAFNTLLSKLADTGQPNDKASSLQYFRYLPPANVRRLTMLARTMKELNDPQGIDRKHALARIAGVYEDILGQHGLAVTDILRISDDPVREMSWLLPRLHPQFPNFWRLEANMAGDDAIVKLLIRLAIDIAFWNEHDTQKQVGMALGLLVLMGWLGQAYDEYQKLSGLNENEFQRYLGIHGRRTEVSLNDLTLRIIAIEAGRSATPPSRTRSYLYFGGDNRDNFLQKTKKDGEIGLCYGAVSRSGYMYFHLYSPLLGLARIADHILADKGDEDFYVRQIAPSVEAPAGKPDDENDNSTDNGKDSIKMRFPDFSDKSFDYRYGEYAEVVNSGFHLLRRFASWVDNRRVEWKELKKNLIDGKNTFLEAFLARFGPEGKQEVVTLQPIADKLRADLLPKDDDGNSGKPTEAAQHSDNPKSARKHKPGSGNETR